MKIAPFIQAVNRHNKAGGEHIDHVLVHTGQHYDDRMSASFFDSLGIPAPDVNLEIGSGSHGVQLGQTMMAFEPVVVEHDPDWIVVVGDVNATLSCSVIAKRLKKKVAHIEAGLRSGDIEMPEEINRLVTDRLSDLLLTPDRIASKHLTDEGVPEEKICFVGNIMIDTLENNRAEAAKLLISEIVAENSIKEQPRKEISLADNTYGLMTMHRPSNVDHKEILTALMRFLMDEATQEVPIVWPLHPRTRKQLQTAGLWEEVLHHPRILLLEPIGYHAMLRLNVGAKIMLTDSGGLQEECCVLGTPCLTLRWNTERPITLREHGGASVLVGNDVERIRTEFYATLKLPNQPVSPEYWDGKTADRIVAAIIAAARTTTSV